METKKIIKVLGITATLVGIGATFLTDWVNEKKLDEKVTEKVNEAFTQLGEAQEL